MKSASRSVVFVVATLALSPMAFGQTLTVSGACPGVMEVVVSGFSPTESLALLSANDVGSAPVPAGPCAGAVHTGLSNNGLALRLTTSADATGSWSLTPTVPAAACSTQIQVISTLGCTMTNSADLLGTSMGIDLSLADAKLIGEGNNDFAGISVSNAGDVNGDGFDDVLVGASHEDAGGPNSGATYLLYGPTQGAINLSMADAKLTGEVAGDYSAASVSSGGDVNGDGFDDLIIGATDQSSGGVYAGAAYVVYGPVYGAVELAMADAKLIGEDSFHAAGTSVSSAGDVNGDGFDDLLVGAYGDGAGGSYAGAAYLVYGPVYGDFDLSVADAKFVGEESGDQAGTSVSSAGDVNGDGFDDILVGAYQGDNGGADAGVIYLFHGPVTGEMDLSMADARLIGEEANDFAGYSVASAGDVNGDGLQDLVVGAYRNDSGGTSSGAAYLVYGPIQGDIDLSMADAKLIGEVAQDEAGYSVSSAGDVNGDGFHDLLVSGHLEDSGGADAGAAYLVYGPIAGDVDLSVADIKLIGEESEDNAGFSVSGAGDVNGDGFDDLVVGAPENDSGGTDAGAAYLMYGPL